jgi:chromosome segregation ATPase
MNAVPNHPERPEGDLAAAQARIQELEEKLCEAEQELEAATDLIAELQVNFECQRTQLEMADLKIDEAAATRRKLEDRIAALEDELENEPCPVPATRAEGSESAAALQFKPYPPDHLKATPTDLADLEALVNKLGWEELMYRLGVIISRQAQEATGPHKAALEAAASLVNLWGPSFHFCDEEVCRKLEEQERLRMSRRPTP